MARLVSGHPTHLPPESTGEPETNPSVPQLGVQRDTREGKAIAEYNMDVDYKSQGSDLDIKAVDEEEENSDRICKNGATSSQDK